MNLGIGTKVLVVNGEPFNNSSATGITMSNLFKGWPKHQIFQIYTANITPDMELCQKNIRLSSQNLKPFSYFRRATSSAISLNTATKPGLQKVKYDLSGRLIRGVRKSITPFLDFLPYEVRHKDLKTLQDFKPDVIYSMLGSIRMVRLVSTLARELNIPVVPHFMDDWVSTYSVPGRSVGSPFHVGYLHRAVKNLFDSIPIAMSIGELMSKEYTRRYSREFFDFMNPVEVTESFPRLKAQKQGGIVRFVYVGGLHLGRSECLADIGLVLQKLKTEGLPVEFCVYAPVHDALAASQLESIGTAVIFKGSVRPEEVSGVLNESNVAVHVESFSDSCAEYTRLSVSTKIPQYFAAGIPVLAYGPSSLASCQYVRSTQAGVLVDKRSNGSLEAGIRALVIENDSRSDMGMRAWMRAREYHEMTAVRRRFMAVLSSATRGKRSPA